MMSLGKRRRRRRRQQRQYTGSVWILLGIGVLVLAFAVLWALDVVALPPAVGLIGIGGVVLIFIVLMLPGTQHRLRKWEQKKDSQRWRK